MKKNPGPVVVKTFLIVSAFLLATSLSISPTLARPDFGVRGGAYADSEDPFLGAEALFHMGDAKNWYGNPNVEHTFGDADMTALSLDVHYDFAKGKDYTVWAGAGPTWLHQTRPGDNNDSDTGANLLVGLGATKGDVRPYGQVKVIVGTEDNQAVLGAGVRF